MGYPEDDELTSTCNPGGPCLAFIDAKKKGYVDPKWQEHLLAHAREAAERERDELLAEVEE